MGFAFVMSDPYGGVVEFERRSLTGTKYACVLVEMTLNIERQKKGIEPAGEPFF